ncbi:Sucrase/ferredoxin-like-domain-containing protein [Copromyces sp. CBS 386.78]|nr:Sucrase/ferredoxin-like-domain-containing protein [Copromyces sp. CBS 386.78]
MLLLRPLRQTPRAATAALSASTARACAPRSSNVAFSFRRAYAARGASATFPTIDTCPSPTCSCAPTPSFPEGFEIDHTTPLNGLMPAHAQQVLICTGKDDWPSKIEDDNDGQNHAAMLRDLIGRGGPYSDPFHNISVLNVSFPPSSSSSSSSPSANQNTKNTSIYLLPDFKYLPALSSSPDHLKALVKAHLLPEKLHPVHDHSPPAKREALLRDPSYADQIPGPGIRDIRNEVIVLICGHGGRDQRCGVYGPLLRGEFEKRLAESSSTPEEKIDVLKGAAAAPAEQQLDHARNNGEESSKTWGARVGLISHIGGHKFAGNVIVYIPPGLKLSGSDAPHPLAGHGIWYGRVEPKHVEGIVKETIKKGNVIKELFRGAIKRGGEILRLPL